MKKLVGAILVLTVITACSTPDAPPPQIASVNTGGTSPSPSAAPVEQRPRLRLDMTPEDLDAIYAAHVRCLVENGVDKQKFETQGVPSKEVMDAAERACEPKRPLPPWENDPKNPEALDFATRVVQCLRDKGVRYVEVSNEPGADRIGYSYGGPNNDSDSITKGLEYTPACEKEASGK
jgi:hypothetical protein